MNHMLKFSLRFLTLILCSGILSGCFSSKTSGNAGRHQFTVGFYNVENLFDTLDDPAIRDEEFTPGSKKEWTPERYRQKLENLAKVVDGMGYPAVLGLAEVENETVLVDFSKKTSLADKNYEFVHFDSPDERGIDAALLYRKDRFRVLHAEPIGIDFPAEVAKGDPDPATRDILFVEGIFAKKDTLRLFVVHAPSRSGGQQETEPERIYVAEQLRSKVNEVFSKNPEANILIMGDFNDEPTDPSIEKVLGAQPLEAAIHPEKLYNTLARMDAEGLGTYNFRGNWNMLDQIILSGNLIGRRKGLKFKEAAIFRQDWMMYDDPKNGPTPSRTYGGNNYYGGFSDHLPVMITLGK